MVSMVIFQLSGGINYPGIHVSIMTALASIQVCFLTIKSAVGHWLVLMINRGLRTIYRHHTIIWED